MTGSKSKQNKGVSSLEFNGIEHYDVFEDDVIIFWIDVSGPPEEIRSIAQEIDGCNFNSYALRYGMIATEEGSLCGNALNADGNLKIRTRDTIVSSQKRLTSILPCRMIAFSHFCRPYGIRFTMRFRWRRSGSHGVCQPFGTEKM